MPTLAQDSTISAEQALVRHSATGNIEWIPKSSLGGVVDDVENTGSGTPIVQKPGANATIYMKGLSAGSNMSITDNGSYLTLDAAAPAYPTVYDEGSSLGAQSGLNFTGPGVTVSSSGYGVDIAVPGGGFTDIQNTGSGTAIVQNPGTGNPVYVKGLSAGSNMSITDNGSYLTLDASGGGSYPTIYNNGSSFGAQSGINFTGSVNVSSSVYGVDVNVYGGGTPGVNVYGNGSSYGFQSGINFVGASVNYSGYGVDVSGLQGPPGPDGPTGPTGPPGAVNDVQNTGSGTATVQNPGSNATIYMKGMQAGSNMSITDNGSYLTFDSNGPYPSVYDEGSSLGTPSGLNFTGTGVTVSSSGFGVDIAIPGGGASGSYGFDFPGYFPVFGVPGTYDINITLGPTGSSSNHTAIITHNMWGLPASYFLNDDGCYDQATGTFTANANTAGLWFVSCTLDFNLTSGTASNTSAIWMQLLKTYGPTNKVSEILGNPSAFNRSTCLTLNGVVNLAVGESFQLVVTNQGGGSMQINVNTATVCGYKIN
jgi:hypothetical protein